MKTSCAAVIKLEGFGSFVGQFYVIISAVQTFALLISNPLNWPDTWLNLFGWMNFFAAPFSLAMPSSPMAAFVCTMLSQPMLVLWAMYRISFFRGDV